MEPRIASQLDSATPMVAGHGFSYRRRAVDLRQAACGEQRLIILDLPKTNDQGKPFVSHWGTVSVRDIGRG